MTKQTKTIIGISIFAAFLALAYWGYSALSQTYTPEIRHQTVTTQLRPMRSRQPRISPSLIRKEIR